MHVGSVYSPSGALCLVPPLLCCCLDACLSKGACVRREWCFLGCWALACWVCIFSFRSALPRPTAALLLPGRLFIKRSLRQARMVLSRMLGTCMLGLYILLQERSASIHRCSVAAWTPATKGTCIRHDGCVLEDLESSLPVLGAVVYCDCVSSFRSALPLPVAALLLPGPLSRCFRQSGSHCTAAAHISMIAGVPARVPGVS